jgi:hypothetical protein
MLHDHGPARRLRPVRAGREESVAAAHGHVAETDLVVLRNAADGRDALFTIYDLRFTIHDFRAFRAGGEIEPPGMRKN